MFEQYWKKIIDCEDNQTEIASLAAISAFAAGMNHQIYVKPDSRESDLRKLMIKDNDRESMVAQSISQASDLTVLPEEVCVVSIGSDDSEKGKLRKQKAIKRKKDLQAQQKSYMAFMA